MNITIIKLIILTSCLFFLGFERKDFASYKQYRELLLKVKKGENSSRGSFYLQLENAYLQVEKSLFKEKKSREDRENKFKMMENETEKLRQMLFNIERQLRRIPQTGRGDFAYQQILQVQLAEQLKEVDELILSRDKMSRELILLKEYITPYKLKIEKIGKILFEKMDEVKIKARNPANLEEASEIKSTLSRFSIRLLDGLEKEQLAVFHLYTLYKMLSLSLDILQIKSQQIRKQILKRYSSLLPSFLNQERKTKTCPLIAPYFYP